MSCATNPELLRIRRCLLSVVIVACAGATGFGQSAGVDESNEADGFEQRIQKLEAELATLRRDHAGIAPESEAAESETVEFAEALIPAEESTGVVTISNWTSSRFSRFQDEADGAALPQPSLGEDPDLPNLPPGFRDRLGQPRSLFDSSEYPTVNWSGFLQLDTGIVDQDELNVESVGRVSAESGLRRVRLRVDGNVRETSTYVIDLDFAASGHPSFRNVMLAFHDAPIAQNIQMGYFKQSIGMQAMTRATDLRFLERTLPFAFDPFRQTGIGAFGNYAERRGSWAFSTFGYPTDSFGVTTGEALGTSLSTRVTGLPYYEDEGARLLHLGMGYSFGTPADNTVRYAIQPGFFVVDPGNPDASTMVPTFVDTGKIPARAFHIFNAELAGNFGSLSLQSEATFAVVDQIGGPTLAFSGAYASVGYVLTGESFGYNRRHGILRSIVPEQNFDINGGLGALELTAGWSYIDLDDKNIQGGDMWNFILGVNWYVSESGRFTLNIIPTHLFDPEYGPSNAEVIGGRAQVEF
ncbi:Porin P precursor [Symmachiella macrocystis]|uniref:Porin P n=1 Tax=Symmachiella macrocystis TaxID=2527985 RepID=A0A5C6BEZ8_9PLAN|nr:porin [Symmachiella macrocystis]TWU09044.1 Porin P precursor [Symmachiella macrocystis]